MKRGSRRIGKLRGPKYKSMYAVESMLLTTQVVLKCPHHHSLEERQGSWWGSSAGMVIG